VRRQAQDKEAGEGGKRVLRLPHIDWRIGSDAVDSVRAVAIACAPVSVGPSSEPLRAERTELCTALRARWSGRAPSDIDTLGPARALYRAFGIDPTKTRPSSEALLRRVLRGLAVPDVSNAVDLGNLLSLELQLPLGLYDAARIVAPVVLRRGRRAESYAGIRKDTVHLAGRPVLADGLGPFGNPTSDSARTAVGPATRSLWMVVFAPFDFDPARLAAHGRRAAQALGSHLGPAGLDPASDQ
jgi:DNA/RNA-binding domain of Phe-tRNA-synthetase-like protein